MFSLKDGGTKGSSGLCSLHRSPKWVRQNTLERDARRLGRSLLRMGDEDEDEEDEDDEDLVNLEVSDVIFTTLLRLA